MALANLIHAPYVLVAWVTPMSVCSSLPSVYTANVPGTLGSEVADCQVTRSKVDMHDFIVNRHLLVSGVWMYYFNDSKWPTACLSAITVPIFFADVPIVHGDLILCGH